MPKKNYHLSGVPRLAYERRMNMLPIERWFWKKLEPLRYKWDITPQSLVHGNIVDFYVRDARLAIEITGKYHYLERPMPYYQEPVGPRLQKWGIDTLVFEELWLLRNVDSLLGMLEHYITERFRQRKLANPKKVWRSRPGLIRLPGTRF